MTITYRAPRSDEAEALGTLGLATFLETFGHLYSPENLALFEANSYAPSVIASEMANPKRRYLVAEDDGRMIGYCKIGFEQTLDYDAGDLKIAELKQIYIYASHQGSGVAQVLTDWAVAEARAAGFDALLLSVYNDNPRGQRFYAKNGFEHVADTYFMVGNHRDDEFLYLKQLGH
jgi:diamine N-acetyltransferase